LPGRGGALKGVRLAQGHGGPVAGQVPARLGFLSALRRSRGLARAPAERRRTAKGETLSGVSPYLGPKPRFRVPGDVAVSRPPASAAPCRASASARLVATHQHS
jgi:hypothetical protein